MPEHPRHDLFKRDFLGILRPDVIRVDIRRLGAQVAALCNGRKHFSIGYSWGGYESLIMPAHIGSARTVAAW